MAHKSFDLKTFIVISVIFHIFIFVFFPMSVFFWKGSSLPEEPEQLTFYLVDYYDFIEIAQEGEDREESELETVAELDGNYEDLSIELEEEPVNEVQPSAEIVDEPQSLAEESVQEINDEVSTEEANANDPLITDATAISPAEDAVVFVDTGENQIIDSDLSDEFIDLPALTVPGVEDILEAFAEESLPEPHEEDILPKEKEEAATEYQNMEPELPGEPSLMVLQRVTPVYPKDAANEGIEGKVEFYINVSESGHIDNIVKLTSSGDQRIDNVAERTVLHGWQFLEMPKAYTIHLEIIFSVQQVYLNFVDIFFTGDGL